MLDSENWEDDFDALLHLVKEFIVAIWVLRKQKLYGDDSYPGQLQHQSSAGDQGLVAGVGGRVGKSDKPGISLGKGEGHVVHAGVNCIGGMYDSTNSHECVVNGTFARAAFLLTLGAHAQRGLRYLVCVCVCLSVCLCLLLNISLFACQKR